MKFLTPEIEALSKFIETKSLVKQSASCGIFQDCNPNDKSSQLHYHRNFKSK